MKVLLISFSSPCLILSQSYRDKRTLEAVSSTGLPSLFVFQQLTVTYSVCSLIILQFWI